MTHLLHVAGACLLCLTLLAGDARSDGSVVVDFSTSDVCRGAEGIAFHAASGTLMAVSGNGVYQFTTAGRLLGSYLLKEQPGPRLRGIHGLPSGNLLLVADNTHRLYEITLAGKCIGTKSISPGVAPRGVAYAPHLNAVFVADRADKSLKQYSDGVYVGQTRPLPVSDLGSIEFAGPGAFLILDGEQNKVFHWDVGREPAEFLDLARICNYEEPDGLALDHRQGVLYICFDEAERIVGVDVSGRLVRSAAPNDSVQTREPARTREQTQTPQQTFTSQSQPLAGPAGIQIPQDLIQRTLVQIQKRQKELTAPPAELIAPPTPPDDVPGGKHPQLPFETGGASAMVVQPLHQPAPIVVKQPAQTIYILPIVIGQAQAGPAAPSQSHTSPANRAPDCCPPRRW